MASEIVAREKAFAAEEYGIELRKTAEEKETKAAANRKRQEEKKAAAEKAKQPVDTSGVKNLEGAIKTSDGFKIYKVKVGPKEFEWYTQSIENKDANRIGSGDTYHSTFALAKDQAGQNFRDLEYREPKSKAPAKEAHIEGKKVEPVTDEVMEKAVKKAAEKTDYAKLKKSIAAKFEQAIKDTPHATTQDAKDSKRYSGTELYTTIDIPGDGQFKVINSKERLEEVKKKLVAAAAPKERPAYRGPTAAGVSSIESAFKNFIDEKEYRNIENLGATNFTTKSYYKHRQIIKENEKMGKCPVSRFFKT